MRLRIHKFINNALAHYVFRPRRALKCIIYQSSLLPDIRPIELGSAGSTEYSKYSWQPQRAKTSKESFSRTVKQWYRPDFHPGRSGSLKGALNQMKGDSMATGL